MSDSSLEKAGSLFASEDAHIESREPEKAPTRDDIHIHNELAYKGDDSDGKVEWTPRAIIAAMTLDALYTG